MTWDWRTERNERLRFVDERMRSRKPVLATTLMFSITWLCGWACSAVLFQIFGWQSIPLRYAASSLVSYAVFFICVRVWCDFAAKKTGEKLKASDLLADPGLALAGGEGCLVMIGFAVGFLVLSGTFFLVGGYAMLFEVAFEVAFAGTLVKSMGQEYTVGNWAGKLFRKTWLPALLVAVILVGFAAKMQHDYPQSHTLAQAFKAMQAQQR